MSNLAAKGQSPFYPGQPVPHELFVGRDAQVKRIVQRGIGQVAAGKAHSVFIEGEYGIGKSSIAKYLTQIAQNSYGLLPIYVPLRLCKTAEDVTSRVVEATIAAIASKLDTAGAIQQWIGKYIGRQALGGFDIKFDLLLAENPYINKPNRIVEFLHHCFNKVRDNETKINGFMLVFDEINGIASQLDFAHLVKAIVDDNALGSEPLPLLFMVCATPEQRMAMIRAYQPVDRLFDVVPIQPMTYAEMEACFVKAFSSVNTTVETDAMMVMSYLSGGLPKILHTIGDETFWVDDNYVIDISDALDGVVAATDQIGKKYVDAQVLDAIRSESYYAILEEIAKLGIINSFKRADISKNLASKEKGKLDNFLQRFKGLGVIRSGETAGEYVFNIRMVQAYIVLKFGKNETGLTPPVYTASRTT